ncbi:glucosidase 2 subunit beta [Clonorchis sinensis]|uniref:Glucosidase 2 subunit beta n=1 Tax=Clonorchis sinensis TaxID=79923 RepID=G7YC70_CLOSI|nr:glucosidase 2 subunit beta [Clonorchis sinensis]
MVHERHLLRECTISTSVMNHCRSRLPANSAALVTAVFLDGDPETGHINGPVDRIKRYRARLFPLAEVFSISRAFDVYQSCLSFDSSLIVVRGTYVRRLTRCMLVWAPWQFPSPRTTMTFTNNSTFMPHRPSRGAISRVALLAAYSRAAIEKLVDPEVKQNYQNQLVECLPDGTVSDINGHWEKISKALLKVGTSVCGTTQPTSFKHWISDRTVSLLETRRQIPPGRHHNSTRRIIRRQVKLSVRADREAWWTRKAQEMEDAKNAGNVRRLFHLIRSTGPRKPLVSETIRDQNGSLICNKAERLDRWAQYFEQQFSWPPATSNQETWPSTESWTVNMESPSVSEVSECISLLKRHRLLLRIFIYAYETRRTSWLYGSEASVSTLMLLSLMMMLIVVTEVMNMPVGSLAAAVEQARSLKRKEIERGHSIFKEYVTKLKVRREEERIAAEQAERERQLKAEEAEEPSESQVTPPSQTPPEPHSEQSVEVPLEPQSSESSKSSEFEAPATEDHVERDVPLEHEDETHQEEGHQSENTEGYHNDESSPPPPKPEPVTEPPKPIDYGPEEAFYMLKDLPECLEYMDPQYTYRFCAFKDIHQRDKGSTSDGTLLGKWSGWATEQEDAPAEQKYSLMKFTDGWGCWNGPARSVKVHVHCSDENKITDVKEPSRCEYEMQLYTPAACYQDPEVLLERLQEEL